MEPPKGPAPSATAAPTITPPAARPTSSGADTSWEPVAGWYDALQGEGRNDHYANVIIPGAIRLTQPAPGMRVLDVACGQGIVARALAELGATVVGVDASATLIGAAKHRQTPGAQTTYHVADARNIADAGLDAGGPFDAATCVMALANIEPLEPVLRAVCALLRPQGRFVAIISHPAFRAPGQTAWGWDDQAGKQYRRVEGYLSAGQTPIKMHPGSAPDVVTWTFHRPLQTYVRVLVESGFAIESLEEWPGQRTSEPGPRATEENRIRREIPLFLALRAVKR